MAHYADLIRGIYPKASELAIELTILRRWNNCSEELKEARETPYFHRKRMLELWNPEIEWHPWAERMLSSFCEVLDAGSGLKMGHWSGSQNSGKSFMYSALFVQLLAEDPNYTAGYISGPYREATRHGLWDYIVASTKLFCEAMGLDHSRHYLPSDHAFILADAPQAGFIRLTTCDKVGMLQGRKPRSPHRGYLFLGVDEVGVFEKRAGQELLDVLKNLRGSIRFRGFTSCNFRDTAGLEGILYRPRTGSYDDLDIDRDQEWLAVGRGKVWRFDGHLSPNILLGEDRYPYLIKTVDIEDMIANGDIPGSAKYQEQIRSFPMNADVAKYLTTMGKIRAGGTFMVPEYRAVRDRLMFIDPSMGGADDYLMFVADRKEEDDNTPRLIPVETRKAVILQDAVFDREWLGRLEAFTTHHDYSLGQDISPEIQGAIQSAEMAAQYQIPPRFVGYDGSMRASIQRSLDLVFGAQTLAMDYGGKPPATPILPSRFSDSPRDLYYNHVSFLWFLTAELLENGLWREGGKMQLALEQLCDRFWEWKGKLRALETKDDYKARNAGRSPNEADCLVGLTYLAYLRANVMQRGTRTPTGQGGVVDFLLQRRMHQKRRKGVTRLWGEAAGVNRSSSVRRGQTLGRRRSR